MFEYIVQMLFPLKLKDPEVEVESLWKEIAKYNFDPGLQVGEEIEVSDLHFGGWQDEPFSFTARVVKKEKTVKPHKDGDNFQNRCFCRACGQRRNLKECEKLLSDRYPGKFQD